MSSVLCEQIWRMLVIRLCHFLLMMVYNCPLAFHHKKGEYTCRGFLLLGGDFFCMLELVELLDCI